MNAVLSQETLEEIFDQVVREVTEQETGIQLCLKNELPKGEFYTVYVYFEKGFHSGLSLCAEANILTRLTQRMKQEEEVTPQDMEDFTKEFFNVLCGQIAARLFQVTKIASRFGTPGFCRGRHQPKDHREHFTLRYSTDKNEYAQLTHHTHAAQC